jgi:hypothetical protein
VRKKNRPAPETETGIVARPSLQKQACGPYQRTAEAKPKARQRGE